METWNSKSMPPEVCISENPNLRKHGYPKIFSGAGIAANSDPRKLGLPTIQSPAESDFEKSKPPEIRFSNNNGLRINQFAAQRHFPSPANLLRTQMPSQKNPKLTCSENHKIRKCGSPPGSVAMGVALLNNQKILRLNPCWTSQTDTHVF